MEPKKSPNDYPQIKFRPGSKLEKELSARSSEQSNSAYSQLAKGLLEEYFEFLTLYLPEFSYQERTLLFQALHGWLPMPAQVHTLWAEVDGFLALHDLSGYETFIARLRDLHPFECWAIADAIRRGALEVACPDQ